MGNSLRGPHIDSMQAQAQSSAASAVGGEPKEGSYYENQFLAVTSRALVKQGDGDVWSGKPDTVAPEAQVAVEDSVRMWLKRIGRISLLTAEQEVILARKAQTGCAACKSIMIEANLRL